MRFQFRLRTLLIVVTLLVVPLGYVGWQRKIIRDRSEMTRDIVKSGGFVVDWTKSASNDPKGKKGSEGQNYFP
jgi:hypothetical protein